MNVMVAISLSLSFGCHGVTNILLAASQVCKHSVNDDNNFFSVIITE